MPRTSKNAQSDTIPYASMNMQNIHPDILIKRVRPDIPPPKRMSDGSVGYDLFAGVDVTLWPGEILTIPIGWIVKIPVGYGGRIGGRSGLTSMGVKVKIGTLDWDYTGELKVIMENGSSEEYHILAKTRIAQLVVHPVITPSLIEVDELPETKRGAGGFGSTGMRNVAATKKGRGTRKEKRKVEPYTKDRDTRRGGLRRPGRLSRTKGWEVRDANVAH